MNRSSRCSCAAWRHGGWLDRTFGVHLIFTRNGAALATGNQPSHTGIIGNQEFRAVIDAQKPFDTSEAPDFKAIDPQLMTHYLSAPTLAEILHQAGRRTAMAGAKPVAQLFDRSREQRTVVNDADRLRKYLIKFGLSWEDLRR